MKMLKKLYVDESHLLCTPMIERCLNIKKYPFSP